MAYGSIALYNNGTGGTNTAVGHIALSGNTTGSDNVALGNWALAANQTGSGNIAIGSNADVNFNNLTNATAIGTNAKVSTSNSLVLGGTGADAVNVGIGTESPSATLDVEGTLRVADGNEANGHVLSSDASGNATWIDPSTLGVGSFWGRDAGNGYTFLSHSTDRVGIGTSTPLKALDVNGDAIIGGNDLHGATDNASQFEIFSSLSKYFGSYLIMQGEDQSGSDHGGDMIFNAGSYGSDVVDGDFNFKYTDNGSATSRMYLDGPSGNLGIGTELPGAKLEVAGHIWQTNTGESVFLGVGAGASDDLDDNENVFIGQNAGTGNTSGVSNTALGSAAMNSNISGDHNTAIGMHAFTFGETHTNSTAVGYDAEPDASNTIRLGNASVTTIGGYANWTNVSDGRFKVNVKENVTGLDFIMKLRPVTYNLDMDAIAKFNSTEEKNRLRDAEAQKAAELQSGFIAQEVEAAAQEAGYDFHGVDAPKNKNPHYGLRYAEFVVPMVKAMQEQQQIIETQKTEMNEMRTLIKTVMEK